MFTSIILLTLIVLASIAIGLASGIFIGWLLTLFLPFTLYEGSMLGMFSIGIALYFWRRVVLDAPRLDSEELDELLEEAQNFEEFTYDEIPEERFYQAEGEATKETWFRYQLANRIYFDIQDAPKPVASMGQKQTRELAVRLSDIATEICKRKHDNASNYRITKTSLEREMNKMGQRPYDQDIMSLAVNAINEALEDDLTLPDIISEKSWSQPTELFNE